MLTRLLARTQAVLPSSCWVCHAWNAHAVCQSCLLSFASAKWRCQTCALTLPKPTDAPADSPFDSKSESQIATPTVRPQQCGTCLSQGTALDACHAAVDYAYPWDGLIARFKYSDGGDLQAQSALAGSLARVMQHVAENDAPLAQALRQAVRSDWIIPVALHPQRQRERGFNQSLALARALFPDHPRLRGDLLLRIKHTAVQADLPREARAQNLRSAFIVAPLLAAELRGRHVTLVDDVTTTTSTLSAAAAALRWAGASRVDAVVFARTA